MAQCPVPDVTTPCPEPTGGWTDGRNRANQRSGVQQCLGLAESQPEYAVLRVDWPVDPATLRTDDFYATKHVLNVRFTYELTKHETQFRDLLGGSLCVTQASQPVSQLEEIQNELP